MSISNKEYKLIGQLADNPAVHCASLGIYENIKTERNGRVRLATVLDVLRNGTITFVESQGKVYGITCWHVIRVLLKYIKKTGNKNSHSFYTMVNGFYVILNRFIKPFSNGVNSVIDIAIRELSPTLVNSIGKKPFNLDNAPEPKHIKFGYAVGFPETLRAKKLIKDGSILSMPQCEILAERNSIPKERFTLHNEFDEVPKIKNYSGMSGGHIFWCDGDNYGIYGIVYEGGTGGEITGDKGIFVYGEYASPEEIKYWISQIK